MSKDHNRADDSGESATLTKQMELDGLTLELEADLQQKQFGSANEEEMAHWAGAAYQLTPAAATVGRGDEMQRIEIPSAPDPLKPVKAGLVLIPLLSMAIMALAWRIGRRRRRAHRSDH